MENIFEKEYAVTSSVCDAEGRLGIRSIFDIYMDLAAEHATRLGVGFYDMRARRCYWVAVRTRVRLYERPPLGQTVTAMTWPGKPALAKCDRFYKITREETVLAEGRTEWAAQDMDTGRVRRADSYGYPLELEYREEQVCQEPFTRFRSLALTPENLAQRYVVNSMDIDVGQHMNNVAYIRMLLGTFTTAQLAGMDVYEMEISYRRGCYEGEELSVYRVRTGDGWLFQVQKPDGETAAQAAIRLR